MQGGLLTGNDDVLYLSDAIAFETVTNGVVLLGGGAPTQFVGLPSTDPLPGEPAGTAHEIESRFFAADTNGIFPMLPALPWPACPAENCNPGQKPLSPEPFNSRAPIVTGDVVDREPQPDRNWWPRAAHWPVSIPTRCILLVVTPFDFLESELAIGSTYTE